MNHLLGPNSPLFFVHVAKSDAAIEQIVQSRVSCVGFVELGASYYNARNRHWEPLLESVQASVQPLYTTAAA